MARLLVVLGFPVTDANGFWEVNVKTKSSKCFGMPRVPAAGLRAIALHCGGGPQNGPAVCRCRPGREAAAHRRGRGARRRADRCGDRGGAPGRPNGHGSAWDQLLRFEDQITAWVAGEGNHPPLTITKIETLLARQGSAAAAAR